MTYLGIFQNTTIQYSANYNNYNLHKSTQAAFQTKTFNNFHSYLFPLVFRDARSRKIGCSALSISIYPKKQQPRPTSIQQLQRHKNQLNQIIEPISVLIQQLSNRIDINTYK